MDKDLIPVSFHGDRLFIVTHKDEPFTPMRPIVEGMGLAWAGQHQKLTANKERWGIMKIMTPSASGNQEAVCMPVRKLPAYLGSISPNKVRPELRDKITLYQAECDDVLWRYWTGQRVAREQSVTNCHALDAITVDENIAKLMRLCNEFHFASDRLLGHLAKDDLVQSLNTIANLSNYALLRRYQHMAAKA